MSEREVRDNPAEQRFEVLVDGEVAGFSKYQLFGADVAVTHTEIDDRFEGQGLGSALVRGLLDALRERDAGAAVLPVRQGLHPAPPGVRRPGARGQAREVRAPGLTGPSQFAG